ncbi:MAG: chitobiase/beta-hexosaminidase C-terminal domain-containing protein, partial [Desulfuromonadales bacterium]|nr:chitobiase/beta-hexosaminidase C-terminal domain-containing protein [Desulfuromonadales bacterium]
MKNVRCVFLSLVLLLLLLPGLVCATPAAPNLSLTTDGLNVTAAWTQSAEAQGYVLYFAPYPYIGEESIGSVDLGAETDISFYLWEDAAYFVAVTAYNGEGESGYSNVEYFIMGPPSPQWVDDDEDGFSEYQGDCKDDDAAISPQAVDLCGDGVDQDCVGGDAPCSAGEVAAPAFDPAAGEYINGLVVTLTSASEQAAIYYTTDGSDPTDASTLYEFPFWIASSQTIKAVAIEGDTVSGVSSAAYTIAYMASSPVVSPRGGTYDSPQTVTIATGEADADIYYTTDGSQPDSGSALYT